MATISVDFNKVIGKVKPLHGVGQPPFSGRDYSMFRYLTEAGIPFSRLHDVGGSYALDRYVDIPNIFRDFDANPYDPASYDFLFTDELITKIVESGVEPFFRLGVTIENYTALKAYRIYPPKDFRKWAVICEHIIRHYTKGWANGFHYNIRYWEIWNEPENGAECTEENQMWQGTDLEYFELYDITARHLKERFPELKIGGYASCGFYSLTNTDPGFANCSRSVHFTEFFNNFLAYIKKTGAPLDFFSWHSYASIDDTMIFADYARKRLDEEGFTATETTCNEWNCRPNQRGSLLHAALSASMMTAMQSSPLDSAMFYDARWGVSIYGGFFSPEDQKPYPNYYSFVAFNELYKAGNQVSSSSDEKGVYVLAAKGETGAFALVSSVKGDDVKATVDFGKEIKKVLAVTGEGLKETSFDGIIPKESVLLFEF